MRFWRFNFATDASLEDSILTQTIIVPKKCHHEGKNDPNQVVEEKLRVGDGVLLAQFDPAAKIGHAKAIGIVRSLQAETGKVRVEWKRISKSFTPNTQGGVAQWQKEACFQFAPDPAKRYGLDKLFQAAFELGY